MIMGATNHPWDIDGAFLRRFKEGIPIGLPNENVRLQLIKRALIHRRHTLSAAQIDLLAGKPYMERLSCDDFVSRIESMIVNLIGNIMESHHYKNVSYQTQ